MKTFVSQTGLATRLGIEANTLAVRLRKNSVEPDGILLRPTQPDVLLFDLERVNQLRNALGTKNPIEANIQA